jgi:NAD(P)-dependent dehydrogenase (short-subunit alcohol dehydrogenase family)
MKSALVTGTVTGIGKAFCEELGKQGYNLTVSSAAGVVAVAEWCWALPSTALLSAWCIYCSISYQCRQFSAV